MPSRCRTHERALVVEKILNNFLAALMRLLASLTYKSDWGKLKAEADNIVTLVKRDRRFENLQSVVNALVLAEDRRYFAHAGVDLRAILRAIYVVCRGYSIQGGSTITQQLVRHLTQDYRRTIGRKYKEMLLATLLDAEFCKLDLVRAYLKVAYFGWRMNGVYQAIQRQGFVLPLTDSQAAAIVARLKFPEPAHASNALITKIVRRASHIESLIQNSHAQSK